MTRVLLILLVTLGFALVACGASEQRPRTSATRTASALPAAPLPQETMLDGDTRKGMPTDRPPTDERKEITTGSAYVTVSDPIEAARKTTEKVTQLGGRVDSKS